MTAPEFITTANALTVAIVAPFAAIAALFVLKFLRAYVALAALKLLRTTAARITAHIRASRKPTWRADWENSCSGVDVLGDGGRRLD